MIELAAVIISIACFVAWIFGRFAHQGNGPDPQ